MGDTTVYAGGDFTTIGGLPRRGLAAIGSVEGPPRLSIDDISFLEGDTGTVRLTNATNAILADSLGQATIPNDDGTPGLSINDISVSEGNAGPTSAAFTVKLSHPTDQPVSLHFQTHDGTATIADNDYIAASGTVDIPAKADSATLSVTVTGDLTPELDNTFSVVLDNPVNATIADSSEIGTITNDDGPLGVSALPTVFALRAAAPNPFSHATVIGFDLPRAANVWLRVYDVRGRLVKTLMDGREQPAGRRVAVWDASTLAERTASPGIYFCEMIAPGFRSVRRMILSR